MHLNLNVLSKLGPEYSVFVITFHTNQVSVGAPYVDPTFDAFSNILIQGEVKII